MEPLINLENCPKCTQCNGFLSVFPIYSYPEGSVCGRCTIPSNIIPRAFHNLCYESLAQFTKFPCLYENLECPERLTPIKMKKHEKSCRYRQYECPVLNEICDWKGPLEDIFSHYESEHHGLTLADALFPIDLVNKYEDNYLMAYSEHILVLHIKFDNKEQEFWCSLHSFGPEEKFLNFFYEVEFIKQFGDKTYHLQKQPIVAENFMVLDESVAHKISVKDLKDSLQDPVSILCSVTVFQEKVSQLASPVKEQEFISTDSSLLRVLECPVCQEYMVPPIYQCLKGHSICNVCKDQISECPTCRETFGVTRNYQLEFMTEHIDYDCKYREFGCTHVANSKSIKEHEAGCRFGPYDCPMKGFLGCQWKGLIENIIEHATKTHLELVLEIPIITFLCDDLDNYEDSDCYLIFAYNQVFRVCFTYRNSTFSWVVQLIGPTSEARNYSYELDFKDNSAKGQRIYIKRQCSPLTKYDQAFDDEEETFQLTYDQLEPLIANSDLTYTCYITLSQ